jgi:hypothetical protein
MLIPSLAIILLVVVTLYSAIVSFRQRPEGESASWIFPDRTKAPVRIFVGIATLLLLVGIGAWFRTNAPSIDSTKSAPRSWRFLIPEGYTGWVHVEFEIPGAPALPAEDGQTVLKIPASGTLKTSSPEQYGWARDNYFFYSNDGVRPIADSGPERLIWGKLNGQASGSSGKRAYEEFFVGTEQQFRSQIDGTKSKN